MVEPSDPNEAYPVDPNEILDLAPVLPGPGLCGFGAGFATMMSMISLGGARCRRHRR